MEYIDSDGQILYVCILDGGESKEYYNSKYQYHRLDGPAIIYNDNYAWYKEGQRHRLGGPAYFDKPFDSFEWHIDGREINIYYICG